MPVRPHILVVGGGYVGMYTAYRLQQKLRRGEADVTVVDPQPNMTYQPFLAEASAGSIEPRHVVVPLRRMLRGCEVVTGAVTRIDDSRRTATVRRADGGALHIDYDIVVLAAGSVARPLPIPGLTEHAIAFKSVGEAIWLRNHVLSRLDLAASTPQPQVRRKRLTFVVVGAGYSGVEVAGELEDLARDAIRMYPQLSANEMRWVLVEAAERIMPEVSPSLADYTTRHLRRRGIDVRLGTTVSSMLDGHVVLSDGHSLDADTIVWTAGVQANPLAVDAGLPVDQRGRVESGADLRVRGREHIWAAGDSAAVPDLTGDEGALCGPTAQHAVRQAKRLADNIVATLRGRPAKPYRHRNAGSVASLGLHKGVAEIYGVRLRGWPAWFLHRTYHVSKVPTVNRRLRVIADWTLALFFSRDVVSLAQVQQPRTEWPTVAALSDRRRAMAEHPAGGLSGEGAA